MISLDGRTDEAKLRELLEAGEQTQLDYKERLDLTRPKDKLNLVKDLISMANRPGGGYLLIGVSDDGTPSVTKSTLDRNRFDTAKLGDLVRKYTGGQIHVTTRPFDLPGDLEVIMIYVEGHRDGLPVPMSKIGQYCDETRKENVVVFREGDLLIREGGQNVPLRHTHWPELLKARDEEIRRQAMADSQYLVHEVVTLLRDAGPKPPPPLTLLMDDDSLALAVTAHIDSGNMAGLQRFMESVRIAAGSANVESSFEQAVHRLAVLTAQLIFSGCLDEAELAIEKLAMIYRRHTEKHSAASWFLTIASRVYALGALVVRTAHWSLLRKLVLVEVDAGGGYVFDSWLRHAQVGGSNNQLLDEPKGLVIALARDLTEKRPELRPDISDEALQLARQSERRLLLDSLCEFDVAHCVLVVAEGAGGVTSYPSFAIFDQERSAAMFDRIADSSSVRRALMPGSTDAEIANSLSVVHKSAEQQSFHFPSWWTRPSGSVQQFIYTNEPER